MVEEFYGDLERRGLGAKRLRVENAVTQKPPGILGLNDSIAEYKDGSSKRDSLLSRC